MRNFISALKMNLLLLLALSLIAGCGTGGLSDPPASSSDSGTGGGTTGGGTTGGGTTGGTTTATPAKLDLLVSNAQLKSDMVGAPTVTLTAIVKDSGNRALPGQAVAFSADSGVLGFVSGTTDDNGMATAKLGASGDPTNRIINVWATAGSVSGTNAVAVTGTQISIDPANFSLPFNDPAGKQLVISLKDSEGKAIPGRTVSMTAASQSIFSAASYVTDNSGQITVTVKNAADAVGDTITASAIGVSSQSVLTINTARLVISAPAANATVPINTPRPFTVTYTKNGIPPVPEQTIYFTTTRGTLTASSRTTVGGSASVNISSANSGPAILTAYTTDGTVQVSTQASIVFVANTAAKMTLSASPAVISTNAPGLSSEQSLIKATIRDASDNLVMGKAVDFSIIQDASGGTLAKASATTDMYGMATTNYIAGSVTGGTNNVVIRATVSDTPTVTATTTLTVGGQALFVTLATGPTIQKVDPNKYQKDYVALVTDTGGRAVENAVITATVTPQYYLKGYYSYCGTIPERWCQRKTLVSPKSTAPTVPACANEDGILQNSLYDFNGILDPGEDQNANSQLDPGMVASVTATNTDSTGHSTVSLVYAQDYAFWVNVRLEVRASLAGSTTSAFQTFDLPGSAKDYSDITIDPPGNPSPFGSNTTCYAALSVIALEPAKISLTWDASAYAASYNIYRDQNQSPPVAVLISNVTKTTYQDPVVAGPTYCYEIKQVSASGAESPLSPTGNRVCVGSQSVAPTGVTATALSPTQIQVTWADAGAATYRIYKDDIPIQYSVTRSIVSANLTANTQYCYAVSSLNSEGVESSKSSTVCATTQLSPPAVPTGLIVTATSASQITVLWTASAGATGYRVYRDGVKLNDAAVAALTDTGLTSSTRYCYAVSSYDAAGNESTQTAQVCATTQPTPPPTPPPVPTGLSGTAVSQSQIDLSWTAVTGVAGYALYRGGIYWTTVGGTTASDTGLTANTQYCYTVASVSSSGGASGQSGSVCVTTPTPPPLAPTGLTVTPVSASQLNIAWTGSVGATGYKVYRGGVLRTSTIATNLADTGLSSGTTYCYTVSAFNATGSESPMATQACAATDTIAVPTNMTVTAATSTQINLSWTASPGAAGYRIYRGGAYLKDTVATSATDTGLTASTTYCYTVRAFDVANNVSAETSQLCATTYGAGTMVLSLKKSSDGSVTTSVSVDSPARLSATVKDGAGAAIVGAVVSFSTISDLSFNPASGTALTDGTGVATITVNAGNTTGATTIHAATTDTAGAAISGSINLSVTPPNLSLSALTITPAVLSAGGSAGVSITVNDGAGNPFTTSVPISFTSDGVQAGKATITPQVYTVNGVASATYRDINYASVDTITATLSIGGTTFTKTGTITVSAASAGSISFVSATPANIALKGTGGAGRSETSVVIFRVLDTNGNAIGGSTVNFSLNTTVGGLALTAASAVSGGDGLVQTIVQAGTVSTPVRVSATINLTTISTTSDQLVISTGIPAQNAFSIAASTHNIEAWDDDGITSDITVRLADHFNNPAPDGTAVSFTSSGGSIQPSCTTVAGTCKVTFTSQAPRPANGRVVILAYALGEESFVDLNGNGIYDTTIPDTFTDKPEPFLDANENGARDATEAFVDTNTDGLYSPGDGVFNGILRDASIVGSKTIHVRNSSTVVLSGSDAVITIDGTTSPPARNIPACSTLAPFTPGSVSFDVVVADLHGNVMPADTTISFSTTNGTIINTAPSYTVPSTSTAPPTYSVTIQSDATQSGAAAPYACSNSKATGIFTVTVSTPKGIKSYQYMTVND